MTATLRGECNCGGIAFEADGPVRGIFCCHCSICRTYTGANGIAVALVDREAFRWRRGGDKVGMWQKPGADWQAWFCPTCGSPVPGPNDARTMFIPAGLVREGGDDLRVAAHIWVGSKAAWDEIGDSAEQYPEAYKPNPTAAG
jgi:hypothetical protein